MLKFLIAVLILTSTAYAQIQIDVTREITDAEGFEIVEGRLFIPEQANIQGELVGRIQLVEANSIIEIEDSKNNLVEPEKVSDLLYLIRQSGTMRVRVIVPQPFDYKLVTITIGDKPTPTPGPTPDPAPSPDAPIPLPGLRVVIVYELDQIPIYPSTQSNQLYSKSLRVWLNNNCLKEDFPQYRVLDDDAVGDKSVWMDVLARPRTSLPWIVISNGTTGYEGPLPITEAETIALIEKYK